MAVMTSSIKESREAVDAAPEKSEEKIISLIKSEISNYPKIVELQKETNERSTKRGFAHCRKFFETQRQIAKENLEEKLTNADKTQLRMNEITVDSTEQDIAKISNNLRGRNLDNELELCKNNNPDECNLTGKYKIVINHSELVISNIKNITNSIVELAYKIKITEKGLCAESENISNYLSRISCIENSVNDKFCSKP